MTLVLELKEIEMRGSLEMDLGVSMYQWGLDKHLDLSCPLNRACGSPTFMN